MSYKTGFYEGRLGIGLGSTMGMGDGNPRYPLDINGDIRLTGSIVNGDGQVLSLVPTESLWTIGTTDITYTGGNVGIGTTSPSTTLHVHKQTAVNEQGGAIFLSRYINGTNVTGGTIWSEALTSTSQCLCFGMQVGGSFAPNPQLVIRSDGNVGIGYIDPKALLHIYGNTHSSYSYSGLLRLVSSSSNGSGSGNWALINFPDSNTASSANENYYMIGRGHQYSDNCLTLHVPPDGSIDMCSTGAVRMMKIQGDGNVGIGTTSPSARLDVWGPTNNPTTATMSTTSSQAVVRISGAQGQSLEIGGMNSTYNYGLWMQTHNQSSTSNTQYSRNLCLQPVEGKVGIGTTSPAVLLDVNGHGWCRSLCVGSYGSFSTIDGGDGAILQISNSTYNASFGIEFSGHTNGNRGGNQALAKIICSSYDSNNYENHFLTFKIRGWGTGGVPHHNPLDDRFWFYGNGHATASAWNISSDDRVKHNERNITNAMNIINKLNAKLYFKSNDIKEHNYNYELDNSGNPITDEYYRLQAGFIAQEVREIPELEFCVEGKEYVDDFENCFKKDASGNNFLDENNEPVLIPEYLGCIPNKLALSYNDIFVYNVVATQELDRKVIALENENAELKTEVATLKSELAAIKQHLGI